MFDITVDQQGTVRVSGRLDASQVERAENELAKVNGSAVVDFAKLEYISSAGIGVILKTYKRLHDAGLSLRLVNMSRRIRNVFEYAGLDRVLTIE